jgi:hypothetical protein
MSLLFAGNAGPLPSHGLRDRRDHRVAARIHRLVVFGGIAVTLLASLPGLGQTVASAQAPAPAANDFPAWDSFTDQLHQLGSEIIAKLPDRLRNNPQVQQEAGRLLLEAVAARTIQAISGDGDHPVFLPALNVTLNVGQPNADTTYRSTPITAGGAYRLRGEAGSLRIFNLGEFSLPLASSGAPIPTPIYHDFKTLHLDGAGHFDVILSTARPPGYHGDWWQLAPATTSLLIRQVAFDWATERDPRISIERLDKPVERPRPDAAELDRRLRELAASIGSSALIFVDHVEGLRRQGYLNRLHEFDVSHLGGLPTQFYFEGAYEIQPDEALIVEAKVPSGCLYWSIILTNDIFETTDWYNNQSSLNGSQARVDNDGVVRYVVANKDPGVPNWLDTSGYLSGAIQGRWNECSDKPIPAVRRVALTEVRKYLPADTPSVSPTQREQSIRDRRAEVQQRPLW